MKFRFTLVLLCLSLFTIAQSQTVDDIFDGRREIYFRFAQSQMTEDINFQGGISIDKTENGYVYAYASKPQFIDFLSHGFSYEKLTAPSMLLPESEMNMRNNIDLNNRATLAWDYYPTYTAYLSLMQQFATNFPSICKLDTIGTSVEGRLLLVVKISDNVNSEEYEPEFFYTSTMHGDETTGYVLMLHLIDYLLNNYGSITRVTNLVNNMEIYINPLANPDGTYAGGNTTVTGASRENANGEDLNRNYPVPDGSAGDDGTYTQQAETQAFVAFIEDRNFVVSANIHGGIELMNYPWDFTSDDHADKTWWMYVCKEYADTAQANSPAGYFDALPSMYVGSPDYPGVVEGYSWYPAPGSRQDYSQYFAQCREVTLEISDTKTPSASTLEAHWNYNYKSLFNYMEQAQYGIKGLITDNCTGLPVKALVSITAHDADSSQVWSAPEVGNYHRPIAPGTWSMSVSAPGYQTATATGVTTVNKTTVVRNFSLIPNPPVANFTADVTSTCSGIVQFTNDGVYPQGSTFLWTFGDGQTSTLENPLHTYTVNNTYHVKLKITSCAGADSLTKSSYIIVNMPSAPTTVGDSICEGGIMNLNATGTGTINWYDASSGGNLVGTGSNWDTPFLSATTTYYAGADVTTIGASQNVGKTDNTGTGSYFTSTSSERYMIFDALQDLRLESVKVYVNSAGNRTFYLKNSSGTILDSAVVNIPTGSNPYTATLNFDVPTGTDYRLTVKTGSSNNLYLNQTSAYPYTIAGLISITGNSWNQSNYYFFYNWTVKSLSQCNSPRVATVAKVISLPTATFNYNVIGSDVDFTNTLTPGATYHWDFGDGNTSTLENPTHNYSTTGSFIVTLVVTNSSGCSDSTTQTIEISNAPSSDFSANTVCLGASTQFSDNSGTAVGTITGWDWDFGDGSGVSSLQNPTYHYSDTGMYNVTLIVESSIGLFDTTTAPVYVSTRPLADFSYVAGFVGNATTVNDLSQSFMLPITSWAWTFGDGNSSVQQNTFNVYNTSGLYTITLIVANNCGLDTATQQVNIVPTGLVEYDKQPILYPNPASESNITIEFVADNEGIFVLNIFGTDGRLVYSENDVCETGNNKKQINIANFANGSYWVELRTSNNTYRLQFVK